MATSNQLTAGMIISMNNALYRVESVVKVNVPKGTPFIKTKLKNLGTNEVSEKSFKLNQMIKDVSLIERKLEYLYPEGDGYLFLDIGNLDQVMVPGKVIGNKINYLKEGIEVRALFYGEVISTIELPQFLELMVAKIRPEKGSEGSKSAILETGAKVDIPPFIDVGDVIKVDTQTDEYIQRI